ncbi:MAG TPA: AAA family ATPase [Thermomicrobiales bacterium]|nr:AAA family ATPase [Thermomicrobiales bacterium]
MATLRDPSLSPDRPPLVGRERELAALRDALAAARDGRGSLALIGGEAGIGKTSLAEALCAEAVEHGALVLVGRCYDLTETPPYGPWREAFAAAPRDGGLPALPAALLPPDRDGEVLGSADAVLARGRDYLAALAARRPLVALLDDLHWADPASFELLRVVARGLADVPLLLLATYRSDELTRRHPLYQLLPTLVREARAARLDLHPLGDDDLRALVARLALPPADADRLAAYLGERSDGNPFFAGELLRALAEAGALRRGDAGWVLGDLAIVGVPPLLRQVIDGRVDRLGEAARDLLAVAAVVGQTAPFALWQAVAGVDEGALPGVAERAAAVGLLAESTDGAGVRFVHALTREALYAGLLGTHRRALHRRAGEALLATPTPDPDAVADHLQRAGDRRAVEWLVRAGERAQLAYAWLTAAERYEAALALLEGAGDDPARRGWLLYRIARLRRLSAPGQSIAYLDEALRVAAAAGDRALAAAARYSRGACLANAGEYAAGIAEMAAGCDALEALPPVEMARLDLGPDDRGLPTITNPRGYLVGILAGTGRIAEALAMGAGLREGLPRLTPLGELGWATHGDRHAALGTAHAFAGRPAAARDAYAVAHAACRAIGNHATLAANAISEVLHVTLPYRADRPDEYRRLAGGAEAARARTGTGGVPLRHLGFRVLAIQGRWREALAEADAALASGVTALWRAFARPSLAEVLRARGERAAAWAQVRAAFPAGPRTAPGDELYLAGLALQRLAAALCLDAGDLPEAGAWLEAHDRWLAWSGAVLGRSEGRTLWARYERQAGNLAAARAHATAALAHAAEPRQPLALLAAHRALGEFATESGQHAEAAAHLAEALALADACAAPFERALTLLALADLHAATGAREAAETALAEARALLEPLEANPALARADALAARLAAAPAPTPAAHPHGLTAREAEVLRLVARGLTDAQVAARLFLSPRTVGTHLTHIYAKLGVENRAAAVAFAIDHGLR